MRVAKIAAIKAVQEVNEYTKWQHEDVELPIEGTVSALLFGRDRGVAAQFGVNKLFLDAEGIFLIDLLKGLSDVLDLGDIFDLRRLLEGHRRDFNESAQYRIMSNGRTSGLIGLPSWEFEPSQSHSGDWVNSFPSQRTSSPPFGVNS